MRKKFIAGNWKMFNEPTAASEFIKSYRKLIESDQTVMASIKEGKIEAAVFPPFVSISAAVQAKDNAPITIGAQNVHWEDFGAYTGEISAPMLKEIGATHAIIGHSERRHIFKEDNEMLNKRVKAALAKGITPIFCVGEVLADRENGKTFDVIKEQLTEGIKGVRSGDAAKIIMAYEPVWAIGTGKTASAEDAQEVCGYIRNELAKMFDEPTAQIVLILYGGSVKPSNARSILEQADIDGVLVGGASLQPDTFFDITKAGI